MSAGSLIYARPGRSATLVLSWLLFAAGISAYLYVARARHAMNPDERVTPTLTQMVEGFAGAALHPAEDQEDVRNEADGVPREPDLVRVVRQVADLHGGPGRDRGRGVHVGGRRRTRERAVPGVSAGDQRADPVGRGGVTR